MVVLKATLPFALGILIISNQAVLERDPVNQELPTLDNCDPCHGYKNLEKDESREDNAVNCNFNLRILKILNGITLLKHLLNLSTGVRCGKVEEVPIGMSHPDMPDKQRIMVGKRREMEGLEKMGMEAGAHEEDKEEEFKSKKAEVKQGADEPFGREPGGHLVQEQNQEQKENQKQNQNQNQKHNQDQEQKQKQMQEKKQEENIWEENLLGLAEWRKKLLRRMG